MTVIVAAVTENDGVVMAADRLITNNGWEKQHNTDPKLWTTNAWCLGAAGCLRTSQVIKHHVTWPRYRPDEDPDLEAFLVKTVVPALRTGVQGHGVLKDESGVQKMEAILLAATGDQLAMIHQNGAILTDTSKRMAIGTGCPEALGRLGNEGPWTEADVIDAARRATLTDRGCGGPISVVNTRTLEIRTVNE